MVVARTIGPRTTQIILYLDPTYGSIPAIITAVDRVTGLITVTTFPPNVAPGTATNVKYDFTGSFIPSWRYHETDVI